MPFSNFRAFPSQANSLYQVGMPPLNPIPVVLLKLLELVLEITRQKIHSRIIFS